MREHLEHIAVMWLWAVGTVLALTYPRWLP